jgi:hypothetical protein
LTAVLALGLAAGIATADDQPAKGGKATVRVTGTFTADKDTTLNYVLKRNGKVVAEEKGLKALPGKEVEVPAADAAGPFELTLSATGGVLRVTKVGLSATADGKPWEGTFGGRLDGLNAKDARGLTVRSVTFPVTLSPVQQPTPEPKSASGNAKNDSGKTAEKPKTDNTKKADGGGKKSDGAKRSDSSKKLPVAPPPVPK